MVNGRYIKAAIVMKGFKLKDVEALTGISKTTLWRKLNGKTEFKASEVEQLCSILEIPTANFFNQ